MSLGDDLRKEVSSIFKDQWTVRDGKQVPKPEDIALSGNDGIKLDAVVLYADIVESTQLVESEKQPFSAEIYKTFLVGACRIIREQNGYITAFDGDRVMAVFIEDYKNSNASICALKINHVVKKIINEELLKVYPQASYRLKHVVGVDSSDILVARTGIKGSNDIVWVGKAANNAAKLCAYRDDVISSVISEKVYNKLSDEAKLSSPDKCSMWESRKIDGKIVYTSNWTWTV